MGPVMLEHMDERLAAVRALFSAALSARVIKDSLLHYTEHTDAELTAGVLTIVSQGEGDYSTALGMTAREGTQSLLFIGHLKLAESATGRDIETAELAFIRELKTALRTGVEGVELQLRRIEHSAQLDHPYGWFVASVDAGPPRANNY